MFECRVCHGEVEQLANGGRCRPCYNAYMRTYMLARYHRRRTETIEKLGGVCVDCGSTESLEFDHAKRTTKVFDLGHGWSFSEKRLRAEVGKCVLRCKECHRTKTSLEQSVEHGGGLTGKRNCYCDKCAPLKRAYSNNWKHRKKLASLVKLA